MQAIEYRFPEALHNGSEWAKNTIFLSNFDGQKVGWALKRADKGPYGGPLVWSVTDRLGPSNTHLRKLGAMAIAW